MYFSVIKIDNDITATGKRKEETREVFQPTLVVSILPRGNTM